MKAYLNESPGGYLTLIIVAVMMMMVLGLVGLAPSIDEVLRNY